MDKKWIQIGNKYYLNGITDYVALYYYLDQWEFDGFKNENDAYKTIKYLNIKLNDENVLKTMSQYDLRSKFLKILWFIENQIKPYFTCFHIPRSTERGWIDTDNSEKFPQNKVAYEMMWQMIINYRRRYDLDLDSLLHDLSFRLVDVSLLMAKAISQMKRMIG
jgi:hypothetical protein